jgi:hypothetical protein
MIPMLLLIFASVFVGLFTRQVGGRLSLVIVVAALLMTSLYLYAPWLM